MVLTSISQVVKTLLLTIACTLLLTMVTPSATQATPLESPMMAALPGFKAVFSGTRPENLGVHKGHLAPCPASPNCVVSQGGDAEHAIAPLTYDSDLADAMAVLYQVVDNQPRTEIIEQTDRYLYAEFTSRLMGFVDDVEFYFDPETPGQIQVRSASRLGESDLGVNRQRIETLRSALQLAMHPS